MPYFLLDYDRDRRRLVGVTPIEDSAEALAAYSEAERVALGTPHEVVLFYGESERDLRLTHSRYFFEPNGANGIGIDEALAEVRALAARVGEIATAS